MITFFTHKYLNYRQNKPTTTPVLPYIPVTLDSLESAGARKFSILSNTSFYEALIASFFFGIALIISLTSIKSIGDALQTKIPSWLTIVGYSTLGVTSMDLLATAIYKHQVVNKFIKPIHFEEL